MIKVTARKLSNCPKCGWREYPFNSGGPQTAYCPGCPTATSLYDGFPGEHLHKVCPTCGWIIEFMPCADATPKPAPRGGAIK